MKKLIFVLLAICLSLAAMTQTSGTTYTLDPAVTYYNAFSFSHATRYSNTVLLDSIGGTAERYWVFKINKSALYYYQFFIEYDTVLVKHRGVGNHVICWLDASIDGVNYITIDSGIFHPTTKWLPAYQQTNAAYALLGAYNLRDVSTGVLYRYLKIRAAGQDANKCSLISKLAVKVGLRY
jgi:hypothetical protein